MKLSLMLGLVLLSGCWRQPLSNETLDDIREATFRYQFGRNASGLQQNANVYFLTFSNAKGRETADPSETFMMRFAGSVPRVAKFSDAVVSAVAGVRDRRTNERGLIFSLGEIHASSDNRAEVEGGYYEGTESSSRNTYVLIKKEGHWKVERDIMHRISELKPTHSPRPQKLAPGYAVASLAAPAEGTHRPPGP
jgi:hypothetical protein